MRVLPCHWQRMFMGNNRIFAGLYYTSTY